MVGPDPQRRLERQAAHCRAAWRALTPVGREALRRRLGDDPIDRAWHAVLDRRHPLADWLDGDAPLDTLPDRFPDGLTPRQLFSSHPFTDFHPWFTLPTSPGLYSTPPD